MDYLKIFILLVISIATNADENKIKSLYELNNISGSIIIESANGIVSHQYNINGTEGFTPASTFKIPNTLIILEEGLINHQQEIIKWDGKEREYGPWNKDQTLKSAFRYSCVWCYQRYAIQVGNEKYLSYLRKFDYGNLRTGSDVTRFWLDGDLRVTVRDQIQFLRKLHTEELPIKKRHIQTLKSIMLSGSHEDYKIWSKTGWSGKDGWFIGYLTTADQTWFFANHIEIHENSDLTLRKKLTMETFKLLEIIQ